MIRTYLRLKFIVLVPSCAIESNLLKRKHLQVILSQLRVRGPAQIVVPSKNTHTEQRAMLGQKVTIHWQGIQFIIKQYQLSD